jgi:hypothetical protein
MSGAFRGVILVLALLGLAGASVEWREACQCDADAAGAGEACCSSVDRTGSCCDAKDGERRVAISACTCGSHEVLFTLLSRLIVCMPPATNVEPAPLHGSTTEPTRSGPPESRHQEPEIPPPRVA